MVIFGIEYNKDNLDLDNFIYKTNERFNKTLVFHGKLIKFKDFITIDMKPLIVPFYWFGMVSFFTILYFWGFNKFSILALMVFSCGFFWTKYFFYIMLKIGLKKEGYKGKISLLSNQKTLKGVIYGTARNN